MSSFILALVADTAGLSSQGLSVSISKVSLGLVDAASKSSVALTVTVKLPPSEVVKVDA